MINDDVIVKFTINRLKEGFRPLPEIQDWVDYSRFLKEQIQYIKLGFTGLGDGDISLITLNQVNPGDRVILDDNLDCNLGSTCTDHAALMGTVDLEGNFTIEAIGQGYDFTRDPDRTIFKIGVRLAAPYICNYHTILRVDAKPRSDGGSLYYFYNKSVLDGRY